MFGIKRRNHLLAENNFYYFFMRKKQFKWVIQNEKQKNGAINCKKVYQFISNFGSGYVG